MSIGALARRLDAIKVLVVCAAALVGGGASSWAYLNRYALASDLSEVREQVESVKTEQAVLRAVLDGVVDELRWQREQAAETARAVGARPVPPPVGR